MNGIKFLPIDYYDNVPYPRFPTVSTAETAKDLWDFGTIQRPYYEKLYHYLIFKSAASPAFAFRQDIFTQSIDGTLLPKHPLIISAMSAPFYGLFGNFGFWVFEQLMLVGLIFFLYRIVKELTSINAALLSCLVFLLGTNLILSYSYQFSYDILGCLLLISGFYYLNKSPFLAGTLLGLAIYVRMSHGLFIPFLILACYPPSLKNFKWLKSSLLVCLGFFVVSAPFMVLNHLLFGDAVRGSYNLAPVFINGATTIDTKTINFSFDLLKNDFTKRLWDHPQSVLSIYPVLYLSLLALPFALKSRFFWLLLCLWCSSILTILLFFSQGEWFHESGHRYVLPSILFISVTNGFLFDYFLTRKSGLAKA
ncbi:MAG: glycosyltransferase family 39 protein [Blastochloris sp.]|nr:glycosyltransferase family 39 protein [Blastochloris sp.]